MMEDQSLAALFAPTGGPSTLDAINSLLWDDSPSHYTRSIASTAISLAGSRRLKQAVSSKSYEALMALADAYDEVGGEGDNSFVPAARMLDRVITLIVAAFREERGIVCEFRLDEVLLPPDRRRLLVLVASHLVAAALSGNAKGTAANKISMTLRAVGTDAELLVEHNDADERAMTLWSGKKCRLNHLASLLCAEVISGPGSSGEGFRSIMRFSVLAPSITA